MDISEGVDSLDRGMAVGLTNDILTTTPPVYNSSYALCQLQNTSDYTSIATVATYYCAPANRYSTVVVQAAARTLCLTEVEIYRRRTPQSRPQSHPCADPRGGRTGRAPPPFRWKEYF